MADLKFGSCALLAGGKSTRMGFDKQTMEINGEPLVIQLIGRLKALFAQVIVVTNRPELYQDCGVVVAQDILPESGPLAGIASALALCTDNYLYLAACDMPNISENYIACLMATAKERRPEAVVTHTENRLEPFNAVYSRELAPALRDFLLGGGRKIHTFLEGRNCCLLEKDEAYAESGTKNMFDNLNSPPQAMQADINSPLTAPLPALRVAGGGSRRTGETVARETEITLFLNGTQIHVFNASPENIAELATGYLFTQGYIPNTAAIDGWNISAGNTEIVIISKNAAPLPMQEKHKDKRAVKFYAKEILTLSPLFLQKSKVFEMTGGVHSCAVSDGKEMLCFFEDIGRHNAVNKTIGYCLLNNIDMGDKLLLTSGRVSTEIIKKIIRAGFPLIVSRSAPTDLSVKLAADATVTLVAFARNGRFNIYSCEERILI